MKKTVACICLCVAAFQTGCGTAVGTFGENTDPCYGARAGQIRELYDGIENLRELGASERLVEEEVVGGCFDQACQCVRSIIEDVYVGSGRPASANDSDSHEETGSSGSSGSTSMGTLDSYNASYWNNSMWTYSSGTGSYKQRQEAMAIGSCWHPSSGQYDDACLQMIDTLSAIEELAAAISADVAPG